MFASLAIALSLWLLLMNEVSYSGSLIVVEALPKQRFPRVIAPSLASFLSIGRRKQDADEKQIMQSLLADYELQVKDLQLLIFGLKTENAKLLQQCESSKQTIQTLRKEKASIQHSVKHDIDGIKAEYERQKNDLQREQLRRTEEAVERERRELTVKYEEDKRSTITELKATHKRELDSKIEEISTLKTKYQQSQLTIEELKKECLLKADQLKTMKSDKTKQEADYAQTVDDLKQQLLRAKSVESKHSTSSTSSKISKSNPPSSSSSKSIPPILSTSKTKLKEEKDQRRAASPPTKSISNKRRHKRKTNLLADSNEKSIETPSVSTKNSQSFVTNSHSKTGGRRR